MEGIVRINDTDFKLLDNYELTFNNYEQLNSFKLKLKLKYDVEFEYFDRVSVNDNHFLLINYSCEYISKDEWLYEMEVANPVIELQNVFLPNRSVESGSDLFSVFRTYTILYGPTHAQGLSPVLLTLLQGKKTKQHTFSNPTLYEALNELLQDFNAIITMSDFTTIDVIFLDKRGNDIKNLKINNIKRRSDYGNHTTILKTQLKNAISPNIVTENVKFTTPNEPVLNDTRFNIMLSNKVEKIISVKLEVFYYDNELADWTADMKYIHNMFVEKSVYDTFLPSNTVGTVPATGYKRNKLYYELGSNVLGGFDYNDKSWFPIANDKYSYEYWGFSDILQQTAVQNANLVVVYEARIDDVMLDMKANNNFHTNKTTLANQSDAYIDLDAFASKNMLQLERSGNDILEITGSGPMPKLMDYYGDFNIYYITTINNNAGLSWYAEAKKGFSYFNLRSAISSEKRFTELESPDKAFLSNHITSFDIEFTEDYNVFNSTIKGMRDIFLTNKTINPDHNILRVRANNKYFILTPLLEKYGNSLVLSYRFLDNFTAGVARKGNGEQYITQYVDSKGELSSLNYSFYNSQELLVVAFEGNNNFLGPTRNTMLELPALTHAGTISVMNGLTPLIEGTTAVRDKTTREITAETIQINLLSNDKVIVWNEYLDMLGWGDSGRFNMSDYDILFNRTDTVNKFSKTSMPATETIAGATFRFTSSSLVMDIPQNYLGFIIIRKSDLKPILAYNGSSKGLYLSEARKKQRKSYGGVTNVE